MGTPPLRALSLADTALLLENAGWIQRLARSLVADPSRADDLYQETWLRLLEHPPGLDQPFRGWIASVMRNLVRGERRAGARRAAREHQCARPESQPSSHELVERVAVQRELVQAVLELEEPYRTTVLLRYFEDRTPAQIAAQQELPLSTVKTRLARGLARLRARLERRAGPDGRNSVLAILSRIHGPPAVVAPPVSGAARPAVPAPTPLLTPLTMGALVLNGKLVATLALLLLGGASLIYFTRRETSGPVAGTALASAPLPSEPPGERATPAARETLEPAPAGERVEARVEPASRATPAAPAPPAPRVRGRVVDSEARPVASVDVTHRREEGAPYAPGPLVRTAPDGSFELALEPRGARLVVSDERWTTILEGLQVESTSGHECLIVVAPRIVLEGVVIDEFGLPVAGAPVQLEPPEDLRSRFSLVLDFSSRVHWVETSDEAGRFRFDGAPGLADAQLVVREEGFLPFREPLAPSSRTDLVLVLTRPPLTTNLLSGLVVDPVNQPVEGALVSHGIETTRTDDRGRFSFRLDDPESFNRTVDVFIETEPDVLRAVTPGYLPAELRARGRDENGRAIWPQSVVLRLGEEPLSIQGLVLDDGEEPLVGMQVWLVDPTLFGGLRDERGGFPNLTHLESVLAEAEPGWHSVRTDERGRFELTGLLERDYVVAAMDPESLLRVDAERVPAGERNLRIVLPGGASYPVLRGQVVDSRGGPVENATVFPMCDAFLTRVQGQVVSTQHESAGAVRTDPEGRFELRSVPRDLVYIRIEGPDTIPMEWGRGVEGGLQSLVGERSDELVIAVERRCHFQVELSRPDEADQIGMLDAAGNPLVISEFLGNSRRDTDRHELSNGRSNTLAVGDRAAFLVLFHSGLEVRRTPIQLVPGEPTLLQP